MTESDDSVSVIIDNLHTQFGLTKREYFAALALQGLLSNPTTFFPENAKRAVEFADSLIEELNND